MPRTINKLERYDVSELLKCKAFQRFLESLALEINVLDSVRDINEINKDMAVAKRLAIDVIENALADLFVACNFDKIKDDVRGSEESVIERFLKIRNLEFN